MFPSKWYIALFLTCILQVSIAIPMSKHHNDSKGGVGPVADQFGSGNTGGPDCIASSILAPLIVARPCLILTSFFRLYHRPHYNHTLLLYLTCILQWSGDITHTCFVFKHVFSFDELATLLCSTTYLSRFDCDLLDSMGFSFSLLVCDLCVHADLALSDQ
ncbi:hypothetical protein BDR04DRAFT_636662 [Suillus decipiens]|nr:hypothetical protein BDR04DRAFT_636662 [Suillus decipiens]